MQAMHKITPREFQSAFVAAMHSEHADFRAAVVFNDVATLRQQLVILGTPKTVREWRFYAYENDGFVLMLPH